MSEDIDWDELATIVQIAGRHFRHLPDWDDLAQEGLIVAWQYHTMARPLLITIIRRRMIDQIRSWYGRTNHSYGPPHRIVRPTVIPSGLPVDHHYENGQRSADSYEPPDVPADELSAVTTLNLRGRYAYIVEALEDGETKQAIADQLGIHPSRISQLLRDIRRLWRNANRPV